ncbi:hypothetical protein [Nocardia sp. CDC160]|uniref:hypothetical protein n=1 Tax=Nocardia sp. CDC160 TaxID=3112166 RepID=UPI002DBED6D1|nr:hypothetical protein [Nocardia sp. CDC160]MEC3913864.1 hypothetical protein [Nocardia sp. CDC160]
MTSPMLTAVVRELPALPEQIADAVRPYIGNGTILEVATTAESADPNSYREAVAAWRTPLRLLLILDPDSESTATRAYADWGHWIAGGGLLALRNANDLHRRILLGGKYRDLATVGPVHILQRLAACN